MDGWVGNEGKGIHEGCGMVGRIGIAVLIFTLCEFGRDKNYKQKPTILSALIRYCSLHNVYDALVLHRYRNIHRSSYLFSIPHNVFFAMLLIEDIH